MGRARIVVVRIMTCQDAGLPQVNHMEPSADVLRVAPEVPGDERTPRSRALAHPPQVVRRAPDDLPAGLAGSSSCLPAADAFFGGPVKQQREA